MPAPTTPILDDFNRANEGPPMTGWGDISGVPGLKVSSNLAVMSTGQGLSYYSTLGQLPNNLEVYGELNTKPGTNGLASVYMLQDVSGAAAIDGYEGRLTVVSGGASDTWRIYRLDNGAATQIATATQEGASGDALWLHNRNGVLTFYRRSSGVWTAMCTATDTTYTGSKYIGIGLSDATGKFDNFGGGALKAMPPFQSRPLYRWIRRY